MEVNVSSAVRALLLVGVLLAAAGGLVIALSWSVSTVTVVLGAVLVGAGQFLALLALAGRPVSSRR